MRCLSREAQLHSEPTDREGTPPAISKPYSKRTMVERRNS